MVFEPYSRTGTLQGLDAEIGSVSGPAANLPLPWIRSHIGFGWILALGGWVLLSPASLAVAQSAAAAAAGTTQSTNNSSAQTPPVHRAVHHRHRAKPEPVAAAPIPPPLPLPPAEQPPNPATIDFKNGLLSVHAQNSSLVNILVQIQHQTGLAIDGLSHDRRVYGQYGPGNISTTLAALLDGAGYDFVIVGAGREHASPRLILSTPGAGGAAAPAPAPPPVVSNEAVPPSDTNTTPPPEVNDSDAPQAETDQPDQPDQAQPDQAQPDQPQPEQAQPDQSESDQSGPADPTAPPQAKSPQEIFDELRQMHPQ